MDLKIGDRVVVVSGFSERRGYGIPTSEARSNKRTGSSYYVKSTDWFGSKLIEVMESNTRTMGMIFPKDCLRKVEEIGI